MRHVARVSASVHTLTTMLTGGASSGAVAGAEDDSDTASSSSADSTARGGAEVDMALMAPVTMSVLNFVDLAGSERMSQAATEDTEKERLRQKEVRAC
jgi:hypothetical protein